MRRAQSHLIRRAGLMDAPGLVDLYHNAYAKNDLIGFPMSAATVAVAEVLDWIDRDVVFVALRQSKPVGVVRLCYRRDWRKWVLSRLAVASRDIGAGIGASLVEHAERHGTASGWECITLTTPSDHPFLPGWYRRMGYRDIGTRVLPTLPYDETVFEKSLDGRPHVS